MPLSSQTVIADLPPPEHYTGMDDILIPIPTHPVTITSERFPFAVVGTDANDDIELATNVYVTSDYFEQPTSTSAFADQWIQTHSNQKSNMKLLTRSEITGQNAVVNPIRHESDNFTSTAYTFTLESHGVQHLTGKTILYHDYDDRYRQIFTLLPITEYQIFTIRAVRRLPYFKTHPAFTDQYEHFLASLQPAPATLQSTLVGSKPLTRRFYTAHTSFEIPIPADADGNNQWLIEHAAKRSEKWQLPEGDIVLTYELISGYDFLPKHENAKLKSDIKGMVDNLPGFVTSMNPDATAPILRYIEVPFGDFALYGRYKQKADISSHASIELNTAYKKGKQLMIRFSGTPALIQQYEPYLLGWVSQIKVMQ